MIVLLLLLQPPPPETNLRNCSNQICMPWRLCHGAWRRMFYIGTADPGTIGTMQGTPFKHTVMGLR